ncbi:hypothetical protein [[Pseudomonas] boreopolis]|uniref:hypothetical protein n=1 Tax=Xanthomonas boreopolis TaxID=86183 RepID=UPI003DA15CBC
MKIRTLAAAIAAVCLSTQAYAQSGDSALTLGKVQSNGVRLTSYRMMPRQSEIKYDSSLAMMPSSPKVET